MPVATAQLETDGEILVDLRIYYDAGALNEDWRPTRKGIALRPDLLDFVIEALERARDLLNSRRA